MMMFFLRANLLRDVSPRAHVLMRLAKILQHLRRTTRRSALRLLKVKQRSRVTVMSSLSLSRKQS